MKAKYPIPPPVKFPRRAGLALFLIKEELKSRKFFNTLHKVGLDHSHFQPHLDELILRSMGMDGEADEVFDFYYELMEKHSRRIRAERDSVEKEAFKVYVELMKRR
jgi:hypothetical protein